MKQNDILGAGFSNILGLKPDEVEKASVEKGQLEISGTGIHHLASVIQDRTIQAVEASIKIYDFVGDYKSELFKSYNYDTVDLAKIIQCCSLGNTYSSPLCTVHFVALVDDQRRIGVDCRGCPLCSQNGLPGCMDVFPKQYKYFVEKNFLGFFDESEKKIDMPSIEKEYRSIVIHSQIIAECYKIILDEIRGWDAKRFIKSMWSHYNFHAHINVVRPELFKL